MTDFETTETNFSVSTDTNENSRSSGAIVIPAIIAGVAAAGAFLVRKVRRAKKASPVVLTNVSEPPSEA